MNNTIDQTLRIVEQALSWKAHVPENENFEYVRQLVDLRRNVMKIKNAYQQGCSAAAFGESQKGKSYLVSAMMSEPGRAFEVTDGSESYNFIDKINPSVPNAKTESTGVVTRFTIKPSNDVPESFLKARLLSLTDMILILCEAYHCQVDYKNAEMKSVKELQAFCQRMQSEIESDGSDMSLLKPDDIRDIEEYLANSTFSQKVANLIDSETGFFRFLMVNVLRMSESQLISSIKMIWNDNANINRLFDKLLDAYRKLSFSDVVYVPFDALLKEKGTLLAVERLDEIYEEPTSPPEHYEAITQVKLANSSFVEIQKSVLSALIAEICLLLPAELAERRPFLGSFDILDFPGARRPENMPASKLEQGKNLSTILRRGKVTFLFNKYSKERMINALLFCHNNEQSTESTMGSLLTDWVNNNIGDTAKSRAAYMESLELPPLFIISTFFNLDLVHQSGDNGDPEALKNRWKSRFDIVLEKEVLKSTTDETNSHWFNRWADDSFKNIYLLRDFKYSREVFSGYDPTTGASEEGLIPIASYPNFMSDLKRSFVEYPEVKKHFMNPSEDWDAAATTCHDGTVRIMDALGLLAPKLEKARDYVLHREFGKLLTKLNNLLSRYYHGSDSDEEIKKAQREASQASMQIALWTGKDSTAFGRMMDIMMIDEAHLYEIVHNILLQKMEAPIVSEAENALFMMMGLRTDVSYNENLAVVMDTLGASDKEECQQILAAQGVDLERLLGTNQMVTGVAEKVVSKVEHYWANDFMTGYCAEVLKGKLNSAPDVIAMLMRIYSQLKVHDSLVKLVDELLTTYEGDNAVGMIADMLAMQLNNFVSSYGFDWMTQQQQQKVMNDISRLKLRISTDMLTERKEVRGVELLSVLDQAHKTLEGSGFVTKDRQVLSLLPQFNRMWKWVELMKIGYVLSCDIPDYDIKANRALGEIIQRIQPIIKLNNGNS